MDQNPAPSSSDEVSSSGWQIESVSQSIAGGNTLIGQVQGFLESSEGSQLRERIWNFTLQRYQDGKYLPPIPVEMRGYSLRGYIRNGDAVRLLDPWQEGTLLQTRKVYNETQHVLVRALSFWEWQRGAIIFFALFTLAMLVLFLIVVISIINAFERGSLEMCAVVPQAPWCP